MLGKTKRCIPDSIENKSPVFTGIRSNARLILLHSCVRDFEVVLIYIIKLNTGEDLIYPRRTQTKEKTMENYLIGIFVYNVVITVFLGILFSKLKHTNKMAQQVGQLGQGNTKRLSSVKSMMETCIKGLMDHSKRLDPLEINQKILMERNSDVFGFNTKTGKVQQFKTIKAFNKIMEIEKSTWYKVEKFPDPHCKKCRSKGTLGRDITKGNLHRACECLFYPQGKTILKSVK